MDRTKIFMSKLAASEELREGTAESIAEASTQTSAEAVPRRPEDLLDIVSENLSRMGERDASMTTQADAPEFGSADWNRARDMLLQSAKATLVRAIGGEEPEADDGLVAEAVVIADGTRPSFLLCNDSVASNDPFIGNWGGELAAAELAGYKKLAKAVGRLQPQHGHASKFVGTGALMSVSDDELSGKVLTNWHVIDDARNKFGIGMSAQGDGLVVDDPMFIDFKGEACSLDTVLFKVVDVAFPVGAGRVFDGIDAAVVTIVRADGDKEFPEPVDSMSTDPGYANGSMTSLATIGFPAKPSRSNSTVDWDFVLGTLFGNRFGVKRLAPGLFSEALGANPGDTGKRAIGHDATTFGGNSGSPVFAWLDGQTPVFALHFAGRTEDNNYALSFAKEAVPLKDVGVPLAP
ncbi:MAG: hypothetical protein AB3N12_03540 [Ruegeria sp.]